MMPFLILTIQGSVAESGLGVTRWWKTQAEAEEATDGAAYDQVDGEADGQAEDQMDAEAVDGEVAYDEEGAEEEQQN
jgi:hypothetical protein